MSDPPKKLGEPSSAVEGVGAAKAPRAAQAASEVASISAPAAAGQVEAASSDVALAEALSTGAVDPAQAKEQLIEEVVRSKLPDDAGPELVERVRSEVEALLADDPTMSALLDPKR